MKTIFKILVPVFALGLILHQNITAIDDAETLNGSSGFFIELDQTAQDYSLPFLLKVCPGSTIQFRATNGQFSVFIRNADKFFENVSSTEKIKLDSGSSTNFESEPFIVRNDLPVDFELKYEVYCISQDGWADAPPRIIIDCSD